jgi:hypothetical protein
MIQQMDAPAQPTMFNRPPKQYEVNGDIALSLAFHQGDFDGAKALLDLIMLLEPMNTTDLVISVAGGPESLGDERAWYDFKEKAAGFFRRVWLNKVRDVRPQSIQEEGSLIRDWRPNNNMFRGVADYFQHFLGYPKKPDGTANVQVPQIAAAFFYLEPDCAILKRDWWSQLTGAYRTARKPFMGVIRQSKRTDGSALPRHMNGCGFYPNPVVTYSQSLYVASTNKHPEAAPFDVAGGITVVPQCKDTNLLCIDFTANPQLNPEAVIWHGDKRNQMKWSMIEHFGGTPNTGNMVRVATPSPLMPVYAVDPAQQPSRLFPETVTTEIEAMPERITSALSHEATIPQATQEFAKQNAPTGLTPPKNAYEAYLRGLKAFGYDRAAWMRAVKSWKADLPKSEAEKVEKKGK